MEEYDIFRDIAERTGGDIYIGVVGPVRTGKSTFIKKFMDLLVIPNIADEFERQRTVDELPQSGAGRTVMTTEPKFIPDEGVEIALDESVNVRVRLVDSVGFPVEGALGYTEEDGPRMVATPWFDYDIPFDEAAEIGTKKVIQDHATIGMVITSDGSYGELPRAAFREPERKAVEALAEIGKPFLILLNTSRPDDLQTQSLADELRQEYNAGVIPVNIARLDRDSLIKILTEVLYEFPAQEVAIRSPEWIDELPRNYWLAQQFQRVTDEVLPTVVKIRDITTARRRLAEEEFVEEARIAELDLGTGKIVIELDTPDEYYYQAIQDLTGIDFREKASQIRMLREMVEAKRSFDILGDAWADASETGYGIVLPRLTDMNFEEPEMVKKGHQFGVRLKATAPSYHIIRADIAAEYTPMLGSERQSEDLVNYLLEKFEDDPRKIWESNIFGKSLSELLQEGINNKISRMPANAQEKLQETIQRIVNEGSGGLICIII